MELQVQTPGAHLCQRAPGVQQGATRAGSWDAAPRRPRPRPEDPVAVGAREGSKAAAAARSDAPVGPPSRTLTSSPYLSGERRRTASSPARSQLLPRRSYAAASAGLKVVPAGSERAGCGTARKPAGQVWVKREKRETLG
jgi:hypothetical protein